MDPLKHIRLVEISKDSSKVKEILYKTSDEWREMLTCDQHVSRESALERKMLSYGMRTHRWSLELYDEQSKSWELVSMMDAIERQAISKIKGQRPVPTVNFVFDAVYTPKEHRGKGYASIMLQHVIDNITCNTGISDSSIPPLITLWSDVGDYYTRFGFKKSEINRVITSPTKDLSLGEDDVDCTLLNLEQSQLAVDYHRAMMVGAVDVMTEKDGIARSIVAPTKGILDQMQWRSEFVSECLGVENPKVYGARTDNGWIAWSYMMTERKLYILVISGPIYEMVSLYKAASKAAREAGDYDVVLYEADLVYPDRTSAQYFLDSLTQSGIEYTINEPKYSIPYYLGLHQPEMKWEFSGRYSWF